MARQNVRHCTFAVETFLRNNESVTATRRAFRTRFGLPLRAIVPDRRSVLKWVKDSRIYGNVATKTPVRRSSVVTPGNVERVRVSVEESPRRSTRRRGRALGISRRSLRTILNKHLNFHPCKIMIVQKLLSRDYLQREQSSVRVSEILQDQYALIMTSFFFHIQ